MVKMEEFFFDNRVTTKFCLVGSGKVLASFANMLLANGFSPPLVLTWKREKHTRDIELLSKNDNYVNIFE